MDLTKQYIVQCISTAANNLRLSSAKIEMVAIFKEFLEASDNITSDISKMKQVTELSKFSIKLGHIYGSLENNRIDFLKISENFKEDSYSLVKELSNMLDLLTPELLKAKLHKDHDSDIDIDLSSRATSSEALENLTIKKASTGSQNEIIHEEEDEESKGKYILDDIKENSEFNFDRFEETILKEIKYLDAFLNRLINYDYEISELNDYVKLMKKNADLSDKVGFEILFNMHKIFYKALELVHEKKIAPSDEVIESMRSCLIVIVAVVRDKDVDITGYLNKAEIFGRKILGKKKEE